VVRKINSFALFPLSPALSLGERENLSPAPGYLGAAGVFPLSVCSRESADAGDAMRHFRMIRTRGTLSPLPEGEGQGEGERRVAISKTFIFRAYSQTCEGLLFRQLPGN